MIQIIKNRVNNAKANENGFTLIELLVVIAVLAILAGIVLFSVGGIRADAQTSACAAEKSTVLTAAEAYKANTGTVAATMATLTSGATPLLQSTPKNYTVTAGVLGLVTGTTCTL